MRWKTPPPIDYMEWHTVTWFAWEPTEAHDGHTYWLCRLQGRRKRMLGWSSGYWIYSNIMPL